MSNDINSAAYRRELRKKKILENAELRKQKIFGLNSIKAVQKTDLDCETKQVPSFSHKLVKDLDTRNSVIDDDEKDETSSTKSFESQISSRSQKSQNQDNDTLSSNDAKLVNDLIKNMPDPLYEYLAENIPCDPPTLQQDEKYEDGPLGNFTPNNSEIFHSPSSSRNGSSLLSSSHDKSFTTSTPYLLFHILEHPATICVVSALICLLISLDLGSLVSNSLVTPFFIWEIQHIIASYSIERTKEENKSFIDIIVLLCGVHRNAIGKYIWIVKIIRDVVKDFALYFVISVLWQTLIGFPSVSVA